MPLSAAGAAVIAAGLNAGTQVGNAFSQGSINRKTRKWNEKMYRQQRADALADWHMQNSYNSPTAQMARFKEAGLNPNLIYGEGANAANASVPRSSSPGGWSPDAPQFDFGNPLAAFYDIQLKEAQVDNVRAQNDVIHQEALLKATTIEQILANIKKTGVDTKRGEFDLGLATELRANSLELAQQTLRKLKADTQYTLDANERAAALQQPTLLKAAEEVLNMRMSRATSRAQQAEIYERIQSLKKDNKLKDFDIELRKQGIHPGSPWWLKSLETILQKFFGGNSMELAPNDKMKETGGRYAPWLMWR